MTNLFGRIKGWFKKPKPKSLTIPQRHQRAVEIATERYVNSCALFASTYCEGGQIPGLEQVDEPQLRSFFENTDPRYWAQLAASNPQEAYGQLAQWRALGG